LVNGKYTIHASKTGWWLLAENYGNRTLYTVKPASADINVPPATGWSALGACKPAPTLYLEHAASILEILILETTIQVFNNGTYAGEYVGGWQRDDSYLSGPTPGLAPPLPEMPKPKKLVAKPRPKRSKKKNCNSSPHLVERLYEASKQGDVATVQKLLDMPVDPDGIVQSERSSPLIAAALCGSVDVTELLVAAGADVNLDVNGTTALIVAHQQGKKDVLRVLFDAAFTMLECAVEGGPAPSVLPCRKSQGFEVSGFQYRELRDVTAKLALMNVKDDKPRPESPTMRDRSPKRLRDKPDPLFLREEVIRQTMKAMLNASVR